MSLARAFLDRLAASSTAVAASLDEIALEAALRRVVDEGRKAWPSLGIDPERFVGHVAERLAGVESPAASLASLHADELYLAFGCHRGDGRAMTALEQTYGAHIEAVYRALPSRELSRDDFRQIVRDKLFVADARGHAKIASYSGQGSLAAWLRITARRAGLNAVRGAKLPTANVDPGEDLFELPASLGDPELDYLKQAYRDEFREAFLEAVTALPARERNLLRQSVTHRLTVRQIGRMYQVHHATAARWVADARQRLIDGTRAALQHRLAVTPRELESIMGLIASRLDVSVARVLGPDDDPG